MDSWSAFKAAINPFSLAARRGVLPGKGPGRVVIFACDSSSNRSLPSYLIVVQLVPQLSTLCVFSWLCAWSLFWFLSCSPAPLSHSLPTTHSLSFDASRAPSRMASASSSPPRTEQRGGCALRSGQRGARERLVLVRVRLQEGGDVRPRPGTVHGGKTQRECQKKKKKKRSTTLAVVACTSSHQPLSALQFFAVRRSSLTD